MLRFVTCLITALCCITQVTAQVISDPQLTTHAPVAQANCSNTLTVSAIHISGNRITRSNVISRELSIAPGSHICADSLVAVLHLNYQRLYNLNLFTAIKVLPLMQDSGTVSVEIEVKEQWFIIPQLDIQLADRNINVWWYEQNHSLDRINIGLYVQHKNFRGNMESLTANVQVGYTQKLALSYYRPYIDKKQRHGLGLAAGYSQSKELAYTSDSNKLLFARDNNGYISRQFDATATYVYRPAYRTRHVVQLGYHDYHIEDTVLQLNKDYFLDQSRKLQFFDLNYRYELNLVDNWNYPRKGFKMVTGATAYIGLQGMDFQAAANLELGYFRRFGDRWLGAFIFRGRASLNDHQPYPLQAALGYKTNYVRGYEYFVVDAYHFGIARCDIKYEALRRQFHKLPFRYLPELPLWLYPKIFFDLGYAANQQAVSSSFLANRWLYSYGFGLDIITAYDLKIRIEFAFNHLQQNGLYLHANSE
jgi:outer membrane protein assembly factor BamA